MAQRGRFHRSAVRDCFPFLFISEELGYQKPQREFFDEVLREMSIPDPGRAVVVGDSLAADILGAINAGLDSIWYNPGALPGHPDAAPTYEAHSYEQVASLILG